MGNKFFKTLILVEPIFQGLILAIILFYVEAWEYQLYLEKLDSSETQTFIPIPFTFTFVNFVVPIALITIVNRIIKSGFFKFPETIFSSFLEGIFNGIVCVLLGVVVYNLNHYFSYVLRGDFESSYFRGFPLYGYPLGLIIKIPTLNVLYNAVN